MKPIRSNSNTENCAPVSSNCVIWQGPDLPCLNLCKGDTVSDVIYKLATELCEIQESLNFTNLDFDCILSICGTTTQPASNLPELIQFIFDKICCTYELALTGGGGNTGKPGDVCCYEEPILTLPPCLQYIDPVTGLPVTQLILNEFVSRVAQKFCDISSVVSIHTSQISNLDGRVTVLENAPCCYNPPTVIPVCVLPSVPTDMDQVLSALESDFCNLVTVLGSNTQISNAAAQQCPNLNAEPALSQSGTMSGLTNWNGVVSNFAQSMQNLWITVCDMRAAIYSLKNCCAVDCSAFILGFTCVDTDPKREVITIIFNSTTVIPSGFTNCPSLSTIKITDGVNTYTLTGFDLVANATLPGGYTVNITPGLLNANLPYTVTVEGCITKDTYVCEKTVSQVLPAPTTTTTTSTTTTTTTAAPIP